MLNMISQATKNRLRVSGPSVNAKDSAEIRQALEDGRHLMRLDGFENPPLRVVIWRLVQDAVETLNRLPDRERSWLLSHGRSIWPEIANSEQDVLVTEWDQKMTLLSGQPSSPLGNGMAFTGLAARRYRIPITDPRASDRMLVVLSWIRFVTGRWFKNPRRDWLIFLELAGGKRVGRVRAEYGGGIGDYAISKIKHKVLTHLEGQLRGIDVGRERVYKRNS